MVTCFTNAKRIKNTCAYLKAAVYFSYVYPNFTHLCISCWLSSHPAYFNQLVMTLRFFRMLSSNPFLFLSLYDANSSGSEIFCFGGWKRPSMMCKIFIPTKLNCTISDGNTFHMCMIFVLTGCCNSSSLSFASRNNCSAVIWTAAGILFLTWNENWKWYSLRSNKNNVDTQAHSTSRYIVILFDSLVKYSVAKGI